MYKYKALRKISQNNNQNNKQLYQTIIKKVIFIMIYIKLDIYFTISQLSQFINNLNTFYKLTIKHLLRYLQNSFKLRLCYQSIKSNKQKYILVYFNLNYTKNKENYYLILNKVVILKGGIVL